MTGLESMIYHTHYTTNEVNVLKYMYLITIVLSDLLNYSSKNKLWEKKLNIAGLPK